MCRGEADQAEQEQRHEHGPPRVRAAQAGQVVHRLDPPAAGVQQREDTERPERHRRVGQEVVQHRPDPAGRIAAQIWRGRQPDEHDETDL